MKTGQEWYVQHICEEIKAGVNVPNRVLAWLMRESFVHPLPQAVRFVIASRLEGVRPKGKPAESLMGPFEYPGGVFVPAAGKMVDYFDRLMEAEELLEEYEAFHHHWKNKGVATPSGRALEDLAKAHHKAPSTMRGRLSAARKICEGWR